MVKLWSSKESIFQCDLTSVCPYQLSYQHPDLKKYLQSLITCSETGFPEMERWYKTVNYANSVYDPHVAHGRYKEEELENFFIESLMFEDNALSLRSSQMIALLHKSMTEFSNTMAKNPKYAYLEYQPVISGSLREKTKTFVPCEADITCAAIHTHGLEIMNNEDSQTAIKVKPEIARNKDLDRNNFSNLCIENNVLCPKRLQSEFCDAMQYAFENTDPELIGPFFLGPFSLKRKDKISCFYMLYRDRILRDLMVCIDFVFSIKHPEYKLPNQVQKSLNVNKNFPSKRDNKRQCPFFGIVFRFGSTICNRPARQYP